MRGGPACSPKRLIRMRDGSEVETRRCRGNRSAQSSGEADRLANRKRTDRPGGNISDVMVLCESVLVGVVLRCFQLGRDVRAFDLIVGRVKDRRAKIRLEDLETEGSGWRNYPQ